VHDHVDPGEPARQGWVSDVDNSPDNPGQVAAVIIDRDYPAEPVRLRQPAGQRQTEVVRRTGHGYCRQVFARWPSWPVLSSAWLTDGSPTGALALGGIAPPWANLGYSVAHREALLG